MTFLVPRGPLLLVSTKNCDLWGGPIFLSMHREFVSSSEPIRFVRLESELAQSDGNSLKRGLRIFAEVVILGANETVRSLWGQECTCTYSLKI